MSRKTVTHAPKPASSITTQAQSSIFRREVDKQAQNPLQPPIWQPSLPGKGPATPRPPTNSGHNFANIAVLAPASFPVQPKLSVGEPHDNYEQEADRIADRVMGMPDSSDQGRPQDDEEAEAPRQAKPIIQRQEAVEEDEDETTQAKPVGATAPRLSRDNEEDINSTRGQGQPLPDGERAFFEPRFGHRFEQVRIHADDRAANVARHLKAQAFTVGHNIFFGANRYQPGTKTGRQLLAHELTHTLQQGTARRPGKGHINPIASTSTRSQAGNFIQRQNEKSGDKGWTSAFFDTILSIVQVVWEIVQIVTGTIWGMIKGAVSFIWSITFGLVWDILKAIGYLLGSLIHGLSAMFNLVFGTPTVLEGAWVEVKAFFAGLWLAMTEPSLFLKALWEDLLKGYEAEESTFGKATYIAQHTTEVILAVITVVKAGKALLTNAGKAGPEIEKLKNVSTRSQQSIAEAGKKGLETAKSQKRVIEKSAKEIEQKVADGKSRTQKEVTKGLANVPGRVQSRINLKNSAWDHVVDRHFNPSKNASQFTIGKDDLRSLLQSKDVVGTPVTRTMNSADGIRYVREINVGRNIGLDKFNNMQPTSTMTVLSDKFGNLVTVTPGLIK